MFHQKKSYALAELNGIIKYSAHTVDSCTLKRCDKTSTDTLSKTETSKIRNPFLGFFYVFLNSVTITLTSVFVKKLSYMDPGHLSFVRNLGVFAGCLPITIYSVTNILGPRKDRFILFVRSVLGATALYLNLTAYRYLPLAEAAVVMSTTPALTIIIARFYLKESCGRVQAFVLVTTVCGVLLSVRLPELLTERRGAHFDTSYLGGLASAVGCVILLSVTFVTLRKMKDIHFSVPLLYFGFVGSLENGIINFSVSPLVYPSCGWDRILLMLIGVFGFMGNCTLTLAIQAEAVGIVAVIKASLDIVVAMIFQIIFFDADLNMYNIVGAFLVILSVSMIGFNKWLHMLPEVSKAKKRFKYFL